MPNPPATAEFNAKSAAASGGESVARSLSPAQLAELGELLKAWSAQLGFAHTAVSDVSADGELAAAEARLSAWLDKNYHGEMDYMSAHGQKRTRPAKLIPGTLRVITVRMDYLPEPMKNAEKVLQNPQLGYVSRYALGRDYHKVMRKKLQTLAHKIHAHIGEFGYRAFCDSAPVLEKVLAQKSGHGWLGKHTNLINRHAGSWFFLGELYTDLPLPCDEPADAHCGSCRACLDICPTGAIVAPWQLDARKCISYLTIELRGSIPLRYRRAMGNRIYGCDDCQLVCPWNRYARVIPHRDFAPRNGLDGAALSELFNWSETEFLRYTEGSPIRRIGHIRWLRNIAVALGNAPPTAAVRAALRQRRTHPSELVREHVAWALAQGSQGESKP